MQTYRVLAKKGEEEAWSKYSKLVGWRVGEQNLNTKRSAQA